LINKVWNYSGHQDFFDFLNKKLIGKENFLFSGDPDLSGFAPIHFERYYLFVGKNIELRIQHTGDSYELERKVASGKLSRSSQVLPLSQLEFDTLKKLSNKVIVRDSYQLGTIPNISIKIYHGDYEGLVRAEFEFTTPEEAKAFSPPDWCGRETSDTPLGRDGRLIRLSKEEFKKELSS